MRLGTESLLLEMKSSGSMGMVGASLPATKAAAVNPLYRGAANASRFPPLDPARGRELERITRLFTRSP